jgi:hypothetical protein
MGNQSWPHRGVRADGRVGGLVHGGHPRAVELAGEPLDVALQRNRSDAGAEVEQSLLSGSEMHAESRHMMSLMSEMRVHNAVDDVAAHSKQCLQRTSLQFNNTKMGVCIV